ncbi:sugar transferase [Crocinitomix catalasitica]|uniref:sugar transferase n=1 Tax=Crocinitomix catalasitica TaxID=184607 RepID=UPI0004890C1C|nr:sugar transferase [Crocinitomix catalasitica]
MYLALKRVFDFCAASIVLILFLPIGLCLAFWILSESRGGVFYKQVRVGKNEEHFTLFKFRSMRKDADQLGKITVGVDNRVTKSGRFIRKYKLDEIPQLLNIILGDMSVVGPRPEVPEYVVLYSQEQRHVLSVKPGLTDYASLKYIDEQAILGQASDPQKVYIDQIMPEKLALNLSYINDRSLLVDFKLIFQTIFKIFK